MSASTSGQAPPRKPNLSTVPYPSPPTSPRPTKSTPPRKPNLSTVPYPSPPTSLRPTKSTPPNVVSRVSIGFPAVLSPPPALRPNPSKPATPTKSAKDTEREKAIAALKSRLGLDSNICGAKKQNGDPCRWYSTQSAKIPQLGPRLAFMVELTQASPELDAKLDELVSFWHCYNHGHGHFKNLRIQSWRKEFPAGKAIKADSPPSIEKQIRNLLNLESDEFWGSWQERATCTAIASRSRVRCKQKTGGQKVQNCRDTIEKIVRPETYQNDSVLEWWLKVLETNMHCHWHMENSLDRVEGWKSAIRAMRGKPPAKSKAVVSPSQPPRTPRSSTGSGNNTTISSASRSGKSSSPDFRCHPSRCWKDKYDESPFHVIAKSDGLADFRHNRIRQKVNDNLESEDLKDGYVYAFDVPGNPGFVKIGYTSRSVEERHEEWRFECNREPQILYPTTSSAVAKVQHAHRVEALCHEDLAHRNVRIYCSACMKQHLEWFQVPSAEAVAVVRKWSKWMSTDPYQSVSLRRGEKWTIRDQERKRTANMETFMMQISEAAQPTVDARRGSVKDEDRKAVRKPA